MDTITAQAERITLQDSELQELKARNVRLEDDSGRLRDENDRLMRKLFSTENSPRPNPGDGGPR